MRKWWPWIVLVIVIIGASVLLNRKRVMKNLKDIRLSKNFTLDEFVVTSTGLDNIPGEKEIENLRKLVAAILQPLREAIGVPIIISSGYRSSAVNAAIGGANDSQHTKGQAADFSVPGMTNQQVIDIVRKLKLPYDQIIDEEKRGSKWIHVSYNPNKLQRVQWLTFRDGKYTLIKTGHA